MARPSPHACHCCKTQSGTRVVQWCRHLELNGVEFPYSRGVSFYEVNDDGKITSARDIPEPTIKPGDSAIYVRAFG